jgi:hypothetical protein
MSSNLLTRSMFRSLAKGRPIRHSDCTYSRIRSRQPFQRRSFFDKSSPAYPRPDTSGRFKSLAANFEVLEVSSRLLSRDYRPSPNQDLAKAWIAFFTVCRDRQNVVSGYQVKLLLDAWNHLKGTGLISGKDAEVALQALHQNILPSPFERRYVPRLFDAKDKSAFQTLKGELSALSGSEGHAQSYPSETPLQSATSALASVLEAGSPITPEIQVILNTFDSLELPNNEERKQWLDTRIGWELFQTKDITSIEPLVSALKKNGFTPDANTLIFMLRGAFIATPSDELATLKQDVLKWAQSNIETDCDMEVNLELVFLYLQNGLLNEAIESYKAMEISGGEFDMYTAEIDTAQNLLVRAICQLDDLDEHLEYTLTGLIEDHPVGKIWSAQTVAVLAHYYLNIEEFRSLVTLLKESYPWYNFAERQLIVNSLVNYTLTDQAEPTPKEIAQVQYHTYTFLTSLKADLPRNIIVRYMKSFASAQMSEEAMEVFTHMRTSPNSYQNPDAMTYIDALEALSSIGDASTVRSVHNYLKLDARVDPDLQLFTALMKAYIMIDDAQYAMKFWNDILTSSTGPDLSSLKTVLAACEGIPAGNFNPQTVWDAAAGVVGREECIPHFVAALAKHGLVKEGMDVVSQLSGRENVVQALGYLIDGAEEDQENILALVTERFPNQVDVAKEVTRTDKIDASKAKEFAYNKYFTEETWD